MEFLYGLDDKAEYRNNKLVSKINNDIVSLFNDIDMRFSADLRDGYLQFGWDAVGVFQEVNMGFNLTELKCYQQKVDLPEHKPYSQVVTRAVETCTFAHIIVGNIHILAHLDDNQLDEGYADIAQQVTAAKIKCNENGVIGFCSRIYGEKENDFSDKLRALCNNNYVELLRHRGDGKNWDNLAHYDLFGHFEIGLSRENGNVVLFGDITDLSRSGFEAPTMRFRNQMELFGAKEELSRNRLEND